MSVHLLGAFAVTLAVLPYAWRGLGSDASLWAIGGLEAVALLAIIALSRAASVWRMRWLDYRALAEGLRYADLGARVDPAPGAPWWQVVLGSRSAATTSPAIDPARLLGAIREQCAYHRGTAQVLGERHDSGQQLSTGLFAISVLGCLVNLFFHRDGLLLLTAALPAVSAALHGVLGSLELDTLANASRRSATALAGLEGRAERLLAAATRTGAPIGREELARLTEEFLLLVAIEVRDWYGEREHMGPPLR